MQSADVTIERRAVRNTRLRVHESGAVTLIVPEGFTEEQVNDLLARKACWIADKRRYFANRVRVNDRLAPNEMRLFGAIFSFVETPQLRNRTELDHRGRQIRTGADLTDPETRRRWYRRFARMHLRNRTKELAHSHGFKFNHLYVRSPWKRWGSASAKRNVSLNWRLIEAPPVVIDYVILHELLHTRVMKHDQGFWAHLRAICPTAPQAREWLERNRPA
jgi:predicted metal-dependent hydrolase